MRPITRWVRYMSSTVTVAPRTSVDGYGKPSYGAAVSYRAHISKKRKLVIDGSGQRVVSQQAVYLMSPVEVKPFDLLTLSTGDVGSTESYAITPSILAVERRFDQKGPHHTVLYLG